MTAEDAIELFFNEMSNEIYHSSADETLKEELMQSLKEVKQTVTDSINAAKQLQPVTKL